MRTILQKRELRYVFTANLPQNCAPEKRGVQRTLLLRYVISLVGMAVMVNFVVEMARID